MLTVTPVSPRMHNKTKSLIPLSHFLVGFEQTVGIILARGKLGEYYLFADETSVLSGVSPNYGSLAL
jgi:hypothetical protein